ncbi:hypothetical protein [Actinomadura chokoriensis]|uniref:hypothetical protein n=1 Tax=Actinomadura chokoriensis TaxID=454156 RepID=UPI0031F7FAAF
MSECNLLSSRPDPEITDAIAARECATFDELLDEETVLSEREPVQRDGKTVDSVELPKNVAEMTNGP